MTSRNTATRRLLGLAYTILALLVCAGTALPALAATDPPIPSGDVRIHYYRPDDTFTGWTLWTWNASTLGQNAWCGSDEFQQTGQDAYGAYWDVPVNTSWGIPRAISASSSTTAAPAPRTPAPIST